MMDVARLAGVSHQTVSRAINRPETVRPEFRAKIADAIDQLGYRPNLSARALVTKRTRNVGLVDSGSSILGHASLLLAVEAAAREQDYASTVAVVSDPAPEAISAALSHLMDRGVDGIIVLASTVGLAQASRHVSASVPVVLIAAGTPSSDRIGIVGVRQEHGARLATRHLIEQGYASIAHLAGPPTWLDAALRVRGWRRELKAAGLERALLGPGDWSPASGYRIGMELARADLPDAVFIANDQMALGFYRAMHERGIRIPDDIAIVGFDDLAGSEHFYPPLTTVRQPFNEVGHAAFSALLTALEGGPPESHSIAAELVVRSSSVRSNA